MSCAHPRLNVHRKTHPELPPTPEYAAFGCSSGCKPVGTGVCPGRCSRGWEVQLLTPTLDAPLDGITAGGITLDGITAGVKDRAVQWNTTPAQLVCAPRSGVCTCAYVCTPPRACIRRLQARTALAAQRAPRVYRRAPGRTLARARPEVRACGRA